MEEVREALAVGAPTAPLAGVTAQLVCARSNPFGGDQQSVAAAKGEDGGLTVVAVDASGGISVSVSQQPQAGGDGATWRTTRIEGLGYRDGEYGWGGVLGPPKFWN